MRLFVCPPWSIICFIRLHRPIEKREMNWDTVTSKYVRRVSLAWAANHLTLEICGWKMALCVAPWRYLCSLTSQIDFAFMILYYRRKARVETREFTSSGTKVWRAKRFISEFSRRGCKKIYLKYFAHCLRTLEILNATEYAKGYATAHPFHNLARDIWVQKWNISRIPFFDNLFHLNSLGNVNRCMNLFKGSIQSGTTVDSWSQINSTHDKQYWDWTWILESLNDTFKLVDSITRFGCTVRWIAIESLYQYYVVKVSLNFSL